MYWVRSSFISKVIAAVLVASMVPALFAPASQASALSVQGSYEQWIRTQLRVPADEDLDKALDRAAETRARTFEQFVSAFLDAYEAERPDIPAARAFTDRDLSDDALISYLEYRFTEIAGTAVLPRLRSLAATTLSSTTTATAAAVIAARPPSTMSFQRLSELSNSTELVVPLRILSAARSQGP